MELRVLRASRKRNSEVSDRSESAGTAAPTLFHRSDISSLLLTEGGITLNSTFSEFKGLGIPMSGSPEISELKHVQSREVGTRARDGCWGPSQVDEVPTTDHWVKMIRARESTPACETVRIALPCTVCSEPLKHRSFKPRLQDTHNANVN
eukprot:11293068-Alexandrium_andersonii.AAC.1